MSSGEEYLDSLLKAALNGEENTDDISAADKVEEIMGAETTDDSNRLPEADEMELLIAHAEMNEGVGEEQQEQEVMETIDSLLDLKEEVSMDNNTEADNVEESEDSEADEMSGGSDGAELSAEEDLNSLLESLTGENEDLQEIGELLQKLDNNELVLDDLEEKVLTDSGDDVTGTEELQEEDAKKEKKGFSLFKRKGKKKSAEKEKIEGTEEIGGIDGIEEIGAIDGIEAFESEPETAFESTNEKNKKEDDKKKSFLSKVFDVLTEEIPEEETDDGNAQTAETEGKKGKKAKKGKKGKKGPVTDASDNEGILEELDAEEADSKKSKSKKKDGKSKKEKKQKEKKQKDTSSTRFNEKKLPTKMVVRIFVLCLSVMTFILVVTFVVPNVWSLADARNAFYKKDYEKTFLEMTGRDLSEKDRRLYEKSKMILQISHKYDAYESYKEIGMPVKALDSLLSGYMLWQQLGEKIAEYDAVSETDAVKVQILDALQTDYQISEEEAQTINALDNYNYTLELEKITGNSGQQKPGSGGVSGKNAEESAGEESGNQEQADANSETEAEGTAAPAEDVLSEEEIK